MDVKCAFNHDSQNFLVRAMECMRADKDLMSGTESFMSDRRVELVIDGSQCEET